MEKIKLKKKNPVIMAEPEKLSKQSFFDNSDDLCRYVSDLSDSTCVLSFSRGKDSIASWLQLRKYFKKIVPVFLYRVPDLGFVDESLKYYEEVFETHIFQLPHPSTYGQMRKLVFQSPGTVPLVNKFEFVKFDYDDVFRFLKEDEGIPEAYVAVGNRVSDNMVRRVSIGKTGPVNHNRFQFYPIYDWSTPHLMDVVNRAEICLPVDYDMFGRSFDGIQQLYLKPIKEHYPDDYEKILEFFPMAEMEVKRIEYREEYWSNLK